MGKVTPRVPLVGMGRVTEKPSPGSKTIENPTDQQIT